MDHIYIQLFKSSYKKLVTNIAKILVKNPTCWQKFTYGCFVQFIRFIRIKINTLGSIKKNEIAMLSIHKQNLATENTSQSIKN